MFSVQQKREIASAVQSILRSTNHSELPTGEIQFHLHVEGAESWSWADIRNNGAVTSPGVNPYNERQALLQQQEVEIRGLRAQQTPVPVSERLPEPNIKVLAHYFNALGNGRTVCAIWVPAKSRDDDVDFADDDFTEYDEEDDKYYWPEGWYEAIENWDEYGWIKICEGEVVYWQPLPKWPAHALPLPAGEVSQ